MGKHRIERLNSLLKEVISDVVRKRVKDPHVDEMLTITDVRIAKDLQHAKVLVSILGDEKKKAKVMEALEKAAGFIAVHSSKEVRMRKFPQLHFILDDSVDRSMKIELLIRDIKREREVREHEESLPNE